MAVTPEPRRIVDFLERLEYGRLLDECDDQLVNLLRELARATERGASPKGSLTIKVNFDLDEGGILHCVADVAVTKPRYRRSPTVLFASSTGDIVGTAPRQMALFAEAERAEVAQVVTPAEPMTAPVAMAPAAAPVAVVDMAPVAPVAPAAPVLHIVNGG